ncbi:hypothetical protein RTG_01084 [Rhodotorula toruloides ATCC 204091]|uniref:Uncharacterized protein n=1 Tax=Rhodotorula toruloides TaxID=5286 RepID=A0A0K3C3Q0_RHOTO|nr:hypothetical protein RTG_01084 [Rhodotorula toruloides ATCC 204091]
MASRTATPQPWQQQAGQQQGPGLQLSQQGGVGTRGAPEGGAGNAAESARATDVNSLMDAVGASGVDLGAEEESLRATNERQHAQAMAAQQSQGGYSAADRSRMQDLVDQGALTEAVKRVAAAWQLKTLEPATLTLLALATSQRVTSLIDSAISARDHRQSSSHFRVPPFVSASSTTCKKRRRDPLDPDLDMDDDDADFDEDEEMADADAAGRPKVPAWDTLVYDDPERTPSGKGGAETPLGKDGKPKKTRAKKVKGGEGGSGASTPAPATGSSTKNLAEDIKKRLTDQTALRSLGGQKFSWLNSSIGSPSPAGGGLGGAGNLPKPKFAPASALPPPSFAPNGASTSTSMLNPANSAAAAGAKAASGAGDETPAASAAAAALTTSRLNIPPMHDAQRTQLDKQKWEAGHHVVELQDLLFALDRERGMGVGSGSGRSAAIRGRSGITRGGYKAGGGQNYRRRQNERGDYHSSPRRGGYGGGYGGGGGGMAMGYDRLPSLETQKNRFKEDLWKLGDNPNYDPAIDIPSTAQSVETWFFRDRSHVFFTFRAAVSEMPHKLPHYAALLARLSLKSIEPPVSLASRISANPTPASWPPPPTDAPPLAPGLPAKPLVDGEDAQMAGEDSTDGAKAENGEEKKEVEKVNVGKEVVQDLMKAFQAFLDERKWKSVRYCVTLFSYLTTVPPASPVISASSLVNLLASFVSVLDEPGLRAARGDECVRIIVEALLRLDENALAEPGVDTLRDGVQAYLSSRRIEKDLFADEATKAQWQDPLEQLVTALSSASSSDADGIFPVYSVLPDVYASLTLAPAEEDETRAQAGDDSLTLPLVLVPPESDDSDITIGAAVGLEHALPPAPITAGLRGDEGVGYEGTRLTLRLFDDESVSSDYDPAGIVVRSLIADVISLYETNRKEAATILLELPKWFKKGTFRVSKPARRPDDEQDMPEEEAPEGPNWSLENLIVESILTSVLSLPAPPLTAMYYYSVLTELCRISPQTVAPSLGKSIRKLYAALGTDREGSEESGGPVLDAEGVRRLADWFSIHLSNYGFMWGWNDWAPDMDASDKHPKRVFVKRTMDLEIRLSYFDRVKNTIPGSMLDAGVFPDDAPGPDYAYEDPEHIHNAAATSFLRMIRAKAPISEATEELDSFQKSLETEHNMTAEAAENVKRDMAVQTILNVGSRSFSHFLNALERYLTLLRNLSSSPSARQHLLTTVASFWKRHPQFHLIVLDKLLQYRLVDTRDVIAWVFAPSEEQDGAKTKTWSDPDLWQMVKITLRSVTSQIDSAKMRVEGLKREEEMKGAENDTGKQEGEHALDAEGDLPGRDAQNPELDSANSYLAEAEDEQASVLVNVLGHFAKLLPADVDEEDWETWWIKGWVREFCRSSFSHKALTSTVVSDGIDKLDLATTSPATKTILDAAKAYHSFA